MPSLFRGFTTRSRSSEETQADEAARDAEQNRRNNQPMNRWGEYTEEYINRTPARDIAERRQRMSKRERVMDRLSNLTAGSGSFENVRNGLLRGAAVWYH